MLLINLSDSELVALYLKGDSKSFEALIQKHKNKIYAFILSKIRNRDLAEDIFQDTFIKVINSLQKGKYNEEGKFLPWVMRIANNLVIDYFRKSKKMRTIAPTDNFDIFDILQDGEKNIEDNLVNNQIHKDLRKLIEHLPEDQKEVLKMRYYAELSFKEISESTGVSINTALGRMRYALINLRKLIDSHQVDLQIS
ncbi:MAG TPA: sigma-70 family RNA polymerase sigma factor [Flavobacteriales bacterium]|mgnify:FL=1|jgi:RNA polymerase sigma factor (sigma-70 family)|nr:sigma-70 family RNA polymerase sigma factor [Flavobacteriales bacterium]|tara:strand:+ start:2966 stop:3553 length:588 start_codon:yes stop_codon:yes gene_type:complete